MRSLSFIVIFLLGISCSYATHIVGGDIELIVNNATANTYTLRLNLYFDVINGSSGALDPSVRIVVFSKKTNLEIINSILPLISQNEVQYNNPICASSTSALVHTQLIRYEQTVLLSPSIFNEPTGYYAVWERCCRNGGITNIQVPGEVGNTFYLEFPPVTLNSQPFINSSPEFNIPSVDLICVNEPYSFDFHATDPDNDVLKYSLVTPFAGFSTANEPIPYPQPAPYPFVNWSTGISLNAVIPGPQPLHIDANTGKLTLIAGRVGLFVFSIVCQEYRSGKKIGEIRMDFQLMVIDCPTNKAPTIRMKENSNAPFYQEGQTVVVNPLNTTSCFNLYVTDGNTNENIKLSVMATNFNPAGIGLTVSQGVIPGTTDTLYSQVCWNECLIGRIATPLEFAVVVQDDGCPIAKTDTLRIRLDLNNYIPLHTISGKVAVSQTNNCSQTILTAQSNLDGPDFAYQWMMNGAPITNATQSTYIPTTAGKYSVRITELGGCLNDFVLTSDIDFAPPSAVVVVDEIACNKFRIIVNPDHVLFQWRSQFVSSDKLREDTLIVEGFTQPVSYTLRTFIPWDTTCFTDQQVIVNFRDIHPLKFTSDSLLTCLDSIVVTAPSTTDWNTFSWIKPDGTSANGNSLVVRQSGLYTLIAHNASNPCESIAHVYVRINANPPPPLVPVRFQQMCIQSPVPAFVAVGNDLVWYRDSLLTEKVAIGSPFIPVLELLQVGANYFFVIDVNSQGCRSLPVQVQLQVDSLPSFRLTNRVKQFCSEEDPSVRLEIEGDTTWSYVWYRSDDPAILSTYQQVTVYKEGIYVIQAQNSQQCTYIDSVQVQEICFPEFFIPDAFSPNEDGDNDRLMLWGKYIEHFDFRVYNRWGEVIFALKGLNGLDEMKDQFWDGKYKGIDVSTGSYPYTIRIWGENVDEPIERKGTVLLLR